MDLEPYKEIIFFLAIVLGQILMVYIPYRNKRIDDGRPFDQSYVYSMIMGFFGMAAVALQTGILSDMPLEISSVLALMFSSSFVQSVINKATPKHDMVIP